MDYKGYFEVQSFNTIKQVKALLESTGLKYSDSGFYFSENDGELRAFATKNVIDFGGYVESIAKEENRISIWYSDDVQFNLSYAKLNGGCYVFFSLSDQELISLNNYLGGENKLVEFFLKLYFSLEAKVGFLCTDIDELDMINNEDEGVRNEFLSSVYLAINPSIDDQQFLNDVEFFCKKNLNGVEYYDRFSDNFL